MREQTTHEKLVQHLQELKACTDCANVIGPVVTPRPVAGKVYLIGQAPGPHEGRLGQPFAWTAGKTLFKWFETIGVNEEQFRSRAYIGAVCRCFPGKSPSGGDRVPSPDEVKACSRWMEREIQLMQPELLVPVGRLAIEQIFEAAPLAEIVGKSCRKKLFGHECDVIPLPHPSGASTWFKMEPGKTLVQKALKLIGKHPAWKALTSSK